MGRQPRPIRSAAELDRSRPGLPGIAVRQMFQRDCGGLATVGRRATSGGAASLIPSVRVRHFDDCQARRNRVGKPWVGSCPTEKLIGWQWSAVSLVRTARWKSSSGRLNQGEAALLLAQIAKAAREAHLGSGQPSPAAGTNVEALVAYVEPSAVGLLPGDPQKGYSLLTLHFGEAVIGIPVPDADGRKLGRTLMAASAANLVSH